MAKKQLRWYVFSPGGSGSGTVKIPGRYGLEQLLLITNTTRNIILYNFADVSFSGTTATFTTGNDSTNFPSIEQTADGYTTITLYTSTVGQSSTDKLSILVEENEVTFRPYRFGTDAIERMRISQGQSMIDADFEYGLQPTKWAGYGIVRGYPSVYDVPGVDLSLSDITTNAATPNSTITVTCTSAHGLLPGGAFNLTGLSDSITGFSRADGNFIVLSNTSVTFTYLAWGQVGTTNGQSLLTDATVLKRGGVYTGANLNVTSATSNGANPSVITLNFGSTHGVIPGTPLYVLVGSGSNADFASGPFYADTVPSDTSITYTARSGAVVASPANLLVLAMSGAQVIHRPFDGGVILSAGIPSYGASVVRVSKKYFRYQSGKGLLWSTGTLFKPNYDVSSLSASGTTAGSTITVTVDDVVHGFQVGALISISGVVTSGYENVFYRVASIVDDYTFTVLAAGSLGSASPTLGVQCKVIAEKWHGATVRAGCFDDQNGMFWEYDGENLCVVRRNSTLQLTGTVSINSNSNSVTGTTTRFVSQVKVGDRIVIRGMTHWVTKVASNTSMNVNPDYRGQTNAVNVKASIIQETRVRQDEFNIDKVDGTGPSGFSINMGRMHMLGIQYTWYGAGFVDYMVRGSDGNWVYVHRIKNNNINFEAHMRTGNLPVRYSVENEGGVSYLTSDPGSGGSTLTLLSNKFFATTGTVYVDNELINYTGKSGTTQLTGCSRAATLTYYINGSSRNFTAGSAAAHSVGTGVIQVSNYCTPTLSHWGSALLVDGLFDSDRGYLFNYQQTGFTINTLTQTFLALRLAPSVSNALIGNLGTKDLINRSQVLLEALEVSTTEGTNNPLAVIVEGVINPKNFLSATWQSLNLESQGGQPSICQVASSSTLVWATGTTYALPGEQVFAFICTPESDARIDLSKLKELTNSPFGGVAAFPNGPDVVCINLKVTQPQNVRRNASILGSMVLRWSEAQS